MEKKDEMMMVGEGRRRRRPQSGISRTTLRWAGRGDYLGGIPRAAVFLAAGCFAKTVAALLNSTTVHNADTLLRLVASRTPTRPLLTVSNHMSTLDDPLLWGFKGFPSADAKLARWVLAAEDICFRNVFYSYFFRLGKCIPITRGAGIYQDHMNEALQVLSAGGWLHTFPEGKVSQEIAPIRRLKWGTASLIVRAPVTPIVLPIVHSGFEKESISGINTVLPYNSAHIIYVNKAYRHFLVEAFRAHHLSMDPIPCMNNSKALILKVMPEKSFFGRRPPLPLCNKNIQIIVGEPMEFDLRSLKRTAVTMTQESSTFRSYGWPSLPPDGLNEAAQRWLYINISDRIRTVMERLRNLGSSLKKVEV